MRKIISVIFLSISIFIYCEIKDKKINFSEKQENSEEVKKIEFLSIHGYTKEKNKDYTKYEKLYFFIKSKYK